MFNTQCSDRDGNVAVGFLACSSTVRDITETVNQLHHDIFFSLQLFGIKNILETPDRERKSLYLVSNAFSGLFNRGAQIALNTKNVRSNVTEFTLFGRHRNDKLILIARFGVFWSLITSSIIRRSLSVLMTSFVRPSV